MVCALRRRGQLPANSRSSFDLRPFLFPSFLFFFFYTIDRICLALSDTHTRINPFQAVARADRNPLQDDDLSRCGTSQDYDKTLHSRFMFSYRDIRVKVTGHETKE